MYIKLALKEASKAKHRQQLGAVLMRGGKPISVGHNFSHVHAEASAIDRAWKSGASGATMVVIRVRRNGTLGMARPCKMCMKRLADAGVKRITYSCSDGSMKSEKLINAAKSIPTDIRLRMQIWNKESSK